MDPIEQLQQQLHALQMQLQEREDQIQQLQFEAQGAAEAVLAAQVGRAPVNANQNVELGRVENVLKTMQTPQIIRDLPSFCGEPVKLHGFIRSIDNLMPLINSVRGTPMYNIWQQSIRAKIVGDADNTLELYGTSLDWTEIKQNLITHYSDRRDEVSLTRDLFKLYQSGTVEDYYSKISHIVSLLINLLNLSEENAAVKTAKSALYQQMGLKVFLSGLRDPLGPIIRAQSPSTLKDALRLCLEENNYSTYKNTKQTILTQPPKFQQAQPQPRIHNFTPLHRNNQPIFQVHQQRPNLTPRLNPQAPPQQQQHQQQQRPSLPPRNVFAPRFNPNEPRPEPMDIDRSIRSRQVNYMNRQPQGRINGPHYQIEYGNQAYEIEHNAAESEDFSDSTSNRDIDQEPEQTNYEEHQSAEANIDELNFCMAIGNIPKK